MGLTTKNFSADVDLLSVKLAQLGERSAREILAVMRDEAENIRLLAVAFAPHDEGWLENAIVVTEDREGINRRTQVSVGVDENKTDRRGYQIYRYALEMHEGLAPFGSGRFHLDEGSIAKDGGRGIVGGKFIERAVYARKDAIASRVAAAARKAFT